MRHSSNIEEMHGFLRKGDPVYAVGDNGGHEHGDPALG